MLIRKKIIFKMFIISSFIRSEELPWMHEGQEAMFNYHGLELGMVSKFIPENPVILEAGAHYGEDTCIMAKTWPQATIYAFEPNPEAYKALENAVSNVNKPNKIHIFPYALFSTTQEQTFYVSRLNPGASSLLEDNDKLGNDRYNDYPINVLCKNLDEWALENGINHIDYMWLDMEGTELHMLKAAPKILKTVKAISCELNFVEFRKSSTQFKDLKEFLENNGFVLHKIWGDKTWQGTGVFVRCQ